MSFSAAELEALIPRLRRYAHALARHPVRADDLVQDALERAWARRRQWRRGTDLRAWTFAILHNVYVSDLRRLAARGFEGSGTVDVETIAGTPDPAVDTARGAGIRLDLERALAALSVEQRTVVLLVGLEDFGYREAADVLDIPIGTVMSRLARGRARLRLLMEGQPARNGGDPPAMKLVR